MANRTELKNFPELSHLPPQEQQERIDQAKARAFGEDSKLRRWRGNVVYFALAFSLSALFMMVIAPALSLSQDAAALLMLLVVLPICFVGQQKRYIRMVRRELDSSDKQA